MFPLDYRDSELFERHRRSRDHHQRRLATGAPAPRRLRSAVGRALMSAGERLTAEPTLQVARRR